MKELKEKIIELVPRKSRIEECPDCEYGMIGDDYPADVCPECDGAGDFNVSNAISLECVLRACDKKYWCQTDSCWNVWDKFVKKLVGSWEFGSPLSDQPKEVIDFLTNLLCN